MKCGSYIYSGICCRTVCCCLRVHTINAIKLMLKAALLTLFIASVWRTVVGNDGDPYTMLSAINTECEFLGLTIGTRLCDSFNSYDEFSNQDRLHHDYMFNQDPHNAAFVRLLHSDRHRHVRGEKRNVTSHVPPNRVERVHHHVNASASIFHAIANKWIYFLGDYSLAPLYRSLLGPLHAHDKKWEFNAWMKQKVRTYVFGYQRDTLELRQYFLTRSA